MLPKYVKRFVKEGVAVANGPRLLLTLLDWDLGERRYSGKRATIRRIYHIPCLEVVEAVGDGEHCLAGCVTLSHSYTGRDISCF